MHLMRLICTVSFIFIFLHRLTNTEDYFIPEVTTADCFNKSESDNTQAYYFNIGYLKCVACSQAKDLQTVSPDGLTCVCQYNAYIVSKAGSILNCKKCPKNKVQSEDGWSCTICSGAFTDKTCQKCADDQIAVETYANGSQLAVDSIRVCQRCADFYHPAATGTSCSRCSDVLQAHPLRINCFCPSLYESGGVCFQSTDDIVPTTPTLFEVNFNSDRFDSAFFAANIQAAYGQCGKNYLNDTACQMLGNMCVLIFYTQDNFKKTATSDACSLFNVLDTAKSEPPSPTPVEWKDNLPWLYYYYEPDPTKILVDDSISTQYTFSNHTLDFVAAVYSANGGYKGLERIQGGRLQLCQGSELFLDAAWNFGTVFKQKCTIGTKKLFSKTTEFFDLYLKFSRNDVAHLHAVPVKILNLNYNGQAVNKEKFNPFLIKGQLYDGSNWKFNRRFFLVDTISGMPATPNVDHPNLPKAIRYASKMTFWIALRSGQRGGYIDPPYLSIQYDVATLEDYKSNTMKNVEFTVRYRMRYNDMFRSLDICFGLFSGVGGMYAFFQTFTWSKRSGKSIIDMSVLTRLFIFGCGTISNILFAILTAVFVWLWFLGKGQRAGPVILLLPDDIQDTYFIMVMITAYVFKIIQLIGMMYSQVTVDLFFVDWEQTRGKVNKMTETEQIQVNVPVSIWRTYFVANEWNEIQTERKISEPFQMLMMVLILEVGKVGNLATDDPYTKINYSSEDYKSPPNVVLRMGVAIVVYLMLFAVQWFYHSFFYRLYVADIPGEFIDLCSVSNISVILMDKPQYGYYIHGRSVHGMADTGLREMAEFLLREEENKVQRRGLLPNTDQQTFQVLYPRSLRATYEKVMIPILEMRRGPHAIISVDDEDERQFPRYPQVKLDPQTLKFIQGYEFLNKYFQAFISHQLPQSDYIVKDKTSMEVYLDTEFDDGVETGIFYNDNGKSFTRVLFFGNEQVLAIFFCMTYVILDLVIMDFTFSGLFTMFIYKLLVIIRSALGLKNLTIKTLVDERFLI